MLSSYAGTEELMLHYYLIPKLRPVAKRENMVTRGGLRLTVLADRLFRVETAARRVLH